jgi:hypothetical protein
LRGVVGIEDSAWRGEMYSAPRDSMEELLGSGACDKYGVYLLLAHNRVYIGQSSDLSKRLVQHAAGKDWWENAVVLTAKDDSLDHTDIDWLESALIQKARSVGRLDCDNRQRGNPVKVDRFKEAFLVPYLDEALFLMELVGITVFCEASADAREQGTRPSSTRIDVADVRNRLAFGKRVKRLAVQYAIDHGAQVTDDNNYAVLKENGEEYFLNPQRSRLSADWTLVLNDTDRRELVILRIPPGSLRMEGDGVRGLAYRRGSRSQIDLHISADGLKDRVSGVDFSKFLVARVAY